MTIAFRSAGAVTAVTGSATSLTPGLPGSLATGDLVLLFVVTKPDTAQPQTPTDWTLVADVAGGGGNQGNGTGPTRQTVFMREKTAAWSSMPTVAVTNGNSSAAQAFAYSKTGTTWSIAAATGTYIGNGTAWSATMGSDPGITAGDWVVCGSSNQDDAPTWSAQAITATGISAWGTATERTEALEATTGNDVGGMVFDRPVTTGTSSAAAVVTATASAASRGTQTVIRLREVSGPSTVNAAVAMTATSTLSATGVNPNQKHILLVHDDPTPVLADQAYRTALEEGGFLVTLQSETAAPPTDTSTYHAVFHTESGSSAGTTAINAYPTMAVPLAYFETSWNAVGFGSVAATNPTSTTQYDIVDNAHPITTGLADPFTWRLSASGNYGVDTSGLPAGVSVLATPVGNATWATLAVADAGATLTSGTAPAKRVVTGLGVGSAPTTWTTDTNALIVRIAQWLTAAAGPATVDAAVSLSATSTLAAAGTVSQPGQAAAALTAASTLTAGATATKPATAALTATSTLTAQPLVPLPALFGTDHVEPESHSYGPAIIDSNGNLYRITESQLAAAAGFQNQPRAMKSTDGGVTWTEMDANNRPGRDTGSIGDLESGWTTWDANDKQITFTWQRSYVVWSGFRTSDHPTNPDTWVSNTRENVAGVTGSPQYASHTSPTDQAYEWLFFNNGSTNPQYRSRSGSGSYGTITALDSAGQHPAAILDSNNVSHVLYVKSSQLHYKTLTSGGTLQGTSTRVDSGGITTTPIAHAAPQAWVNGGNTYVGALFGNGSNHLKFVLITNGTPGSEETVTTNAVVVDPGATGGQGIVASLAVDPTNGTMHALWSQVSNGDLMHSERPVGGAWSTPATLQNPAFTPAWVYGKVNTYPSGRRVLSAIYVQEVLDDQSNVWYDEKVLGSGATTVNAAVALTATSTLTAGAVRTVPATVALTAASTLTAGAVRTVPAAAALTATSTLTTAAVRVVLPAVALTTASTLTAGALRTVNPAVALTSSAVLTSGAFRELFVTVALAAASTLTAGAVRTVPAAAALTATSTLTTAAVRTVPASVALVGTSILTVTAATAGVVDAAVALTAVSTLTTAAVRVVVPAVALTAASTLTAGAVRTVLPAVALTTASTLTAGAVRTVLPVVALVGVSALTVASVSTRNATVALVAASALTAGGIVTEHATVALVSASSLTVAAVRVVLPAVALTGASTIVTAAVRERPAAVALVAAHTMDVLADSTGQKSGAVDFVATHTTTVAAERVRPAAVALVAAHTTTTVAVRAVPVAVALVSTHTLAAGAVRARPAVVALTASSTLTVTVTGAVPATVALLAVASLITSAVRERPAAVELLSVSSLVAVAGILRPALVALEAAASLEVTGVRARLAGVSLASVASLVVYATVFGMEDISDLVWATMRPNTTRAIFRENGTGTLRPNTTRALMRETT